LARFPENDIISLVRATPRFDLAESVGPSIRTAEWLDEISLSSLGDIPLDYATAEGNPALRKAIANLHGVSPDDVVVTVGGMHALFLVSFILCDREDDVVTTTPSFPLARSALDVVGATVRTLTLSFDQAYRPDLAELPGLLSPRTRLVSLSSPQNPSGTSITLETLEAVHAHMEARCPRAFLLVDETYRHAAYGDNPIARSAVTLGPKIISVGSLSKCHGAPGLRLGWIVTRDPELRRQLVVGKFNTVICCSPVDELLALKVLEHSDRIMVQRRVHLAQGLARTADWVTRNERFVDWVRPDAGALCCVRLRPSVFDDLAVRRFYQVLVSEDVRVAEGAWFGDEARVFRLGFGLLSVSDLDAGLERLAAALRRAAPAG